MTLETHVETRSQCLQYGRYLLLSKGREWVWCLLLGAVCSWSWRRARGRLSWWLGSSSGGGLLSRGLCGSHCGRDRFVGVLMFFQEYTCKVSLQGIL